MILSPGYRVKSVQRVFIQTTSTIISPGIFIIILLIAFMYGCLAPPVTEEDQPPVLFDFTEEFDINSVIKRDVNVTLLGNKFLRVDVFDPGFRRALGESLVRGKDRAIGDPWCIGFFVHNELSWGDETSLAVATLVSPAGQPAKKVFIADLRQNTN